MSDSVISRAIIEIVGDSRRLRASVEDARKSIRTLGEGQKDISKSASASIDTYVGKLKQQNATLGMSTRETALYKLGLRGASNEQINAANSALRMAESHRQLESVGSALRIGFIASFTGAVFALKQMIEKAQEAEQESNRLEAVLRNTGGAAGYTRHEIEGMAEALAESTQFDDESIKKAAAEILAFGKIHGETFKEVLKLSIDLAAFWGTDLPSAAKNVSKALADPEAAFKLLKSAGVALSEQQKDQLKHMGALGDTMGQQRLILDLLQKGFRGTAETMNTGFTRATTGASKAWNELLESLGKTAVVHGTATSGLGFIEQSLKDIKEIVEHGDWIEKGLALTAFAGGMRGFKLTPQPPAPDRPGAVTGKIGNLPVPLPAEISDVDYAAQKLSRLTAFGLSEINLSAQRDAMAAELKIMDDFHHDGYISEEKYYADRHKLIEESLISELTAVQAGEAAQRALQANAKTPEELAAAGLALVKLDAARDKAIREANVQEQVVTSQQRRAKVALDQEIGTAEIAHISALSNALEQQRDIRISAAAADKDYLSDLQFEIDLIGKTAIEQQKMNEVRKIDLKLREDLRSAAALDPTGESAGYRETVAALTKATAAQKALVLDSVTTRIKLERDWATGAKAAFDDYVDHATNKAEQMKDVVTKGLSSIEDSLVSFLTTAKLDLKSLGNSIASEVTRAAVRETITGPLAKNGMGMLSLVGNWFGAGTQKPAPVDERSFGTALSGAAGGLAGDAPLAALSASATAADTGLIAMTASMTVADTGLTTLTTAATSAAIALDAIAASSAASGSGGSIAGLFGNTAGMSNGSFGSYGGGVGGAAKGGLISGPGTGTSDSVPAMLGTTPFALSNREFVVRAAKVEEPGTLAFLNTVNDRGLTTAMSELSRKIITQRHDLGKTIAKSNVIPMARGGVVRTIGSAPEIKQSARAALWVAASLLPATIAAAPIPATPNLASIVNIAGSTAITNSTIAAIPSNSVAPAGPVLGSFDTGIAFVPQTGIYQLHQGERVTPASENNGGRQVVINMPITFQGPQDTRSVSQAMVGAGRRLQRELARGTA